MLGSVADPEKNLGGAEKHATTTCSSLRHPTKEKYNSLKQYDIETSMTDGNLKIHHEKIKIQFIHTEKPKYETNRRRA